MWSGSARIWRWATLVLAATLAGCGGVSPIYKDKSDAGVLDAGVTPKRNWSASGQLDGPTNAIDGKLETAAVAASNYTNKFITIDLKKPCTMNMVVIDHGDAVDGFARLVEVAISMDGADYQIVYTGLGTRRVTTLLLPRPVLARYVRLRAVRAGAQPWNLAEIYIQ